MNTCTNVPAEVVELIEASCLCKDFMCGNCTRMIAAIGKLAIDAERYRWLRLGHNDAAGVRAIRRDNVVGFDFDKHKWTDLYGGILDTAIDTARKGAGEI